MIEKTDAYNTSFHAILRSAEERHFWFNVRRRWIYDRVRRFVPPPARIVEIGCGTGNVSSFLAKKGYDVTGCEYYQQALDIAWPGFTKVRADASSLPFEEGVFDAAGLFDVIEHFEDDAVPLTEAVRVVKPGGMIFITVPARSELWSPYDVEASHKRRYSWKALRKLMESAGLAVSSAEYIFMSLYIPMMLMRRRNAGVEDQFRISGIANSLLRIVFDLERVVSKAIRLPIGTSLLAVAHKR